MVVRIIYNYERESVVINKKLRLGILAKNLNSKSESYLEYAQSLSPNHIW